MMRLRNRIGILAIFGTGCALTLLLVLFFKTIRKSEPVPPQQLNAETATQDNLSRVPFKEAATTVTENEITEESDATNAAGASKETAALEEIFLSGETGDDATIDWTEVQQLLRDHVDSNQLRLALSDDDYARLADSLRRYREARVKIGSLERTSANSGALREALEENKSALETFKQITGMSPGEFFMEENAPVKFGDETSGSEDEEIVTEYLSDHKP